MKHRVFVVSLALAAATAISAFAQASNPPALQEEISRMDRTLSEAFNAHDLDRLMSLFSEDLEFYHDTGGLEAHAEVTEGFKALFARNDGIRRELVPGSLRIYPVKGYGAIEVGSHRFCHDEHGRPDCGTFEFVHIWKKQDAQWRITRVVSYGH